MPTIITDMYFPENHKHFNLQKLRKYESEDMEQIRKNIRKKDGDDEEAITQRRLQKEIVRVLRSEKERDKLKSIVYFNEHVFKMSGEVQYFIDGTLTPSSVKDFKETYIEKCGDILDIYFKKELDMIYTHTIDPFNYQKIIYKQIDEENRYYVNDIDPPRFKYNKNHEKNNKFVQTYKEIIKNVVCRKNINFFDWVWLLIASLIQGYKFQSILYLYGPQGCGKSWIVSIIAHMLGERFLPVTINSLSSQFNKDIFGRILLNLDETSDNNGSKNATPREKIATDFLKMISTTYNAALEAKYQNKIKCMITCNTIVTSNHLLIDKRELGEGRRWCMAMCYNHYDDTFWDSVKDYAANPENHEKDYYALFCELMEVDVSGFINNCQNMYKALKLDIKELLCSDSLPNTALYLKELAINSLKDKQLAKENFTKATRIKFKDNCNKFLLSKGLNTVRKDTIEETMNELKIGCETNLKTKQVYYKCTNEQLINKLKAKKYLTNEELADINAGGKILLTKSDIINDEEEEKEKQRAQKIFNDQKDKIEEQEDKIKELMKEIEELKSKLGEKEEVREGIKGPDVISISTGKMIFEGKLLKNLCDIAQKHEEIIFD